MTFAVGSLVSARGREWVVQPESTAELLVLRPLRGSPAEVAGLYLPIEGADIAAAEFGLPSADHLGDANASRLLRDAVRLGLQHSAGPFRSSGSISVEPRPYQLVPLLMALRLDPVRLLIADDVGIGKTIEAALIARELLDRGEIQRLAVLCPPHLAEQWQAELESKFNLAAELVLPATVGRLERRLAANESLFDRHPFVIVSTDYIKADRRRDEFVRACPELVIVDEAHTCAYSAESRGGRHQRHRLLAQLASDPSRHLLLVTATPHSGDEGAFRSLLSLLRRDFASLPEDLTGEANATLRADIARHLVQRRRADVRDYVESTTPFPERQERDEGYSLDREYRQLFDTVIAYCRERVAAAGQDRRRQRVSWWSALALLRALASSPAAAAETLRNRSQTADSETVEEANASGRRYVLDQDDTDDQEPLDISPGGQEEAAGPLHDRLLGYARRAEALAGPMHDFKLRRATALLGELLAEGHQPIVFCRFIRTAEYVAEQLRQAVGKQLPAGVEVAAVTGDLPPAEREERVARLADHERHLLVATDCLSEGINLQQHFDAVLHYDLSWNPTRHEQREGRVDRFGQPRPLVCAVTLYGIDNQIDGLVLDVLVRKHRTIRSSLGISVPVPANSNDVLEAIVQGLLLRASRQPDARQLMLTGFELGQRDALHRDWDRAREREQRTRSLFAQRSIRPEEVLREWRSVREAVGSSVDVERFVTLAVRALGGQVEQHRGASRLLMGTKPLQELAGAPSLEARYELPVSEQVTYLHRAHPLVQRLAQTILDQALDAANAVAPQNTVGRRAGVMRTADVGRTTVLLLLRLRCHLTRQGAAGEAALLAEETLLAAYQPADVPDAPPLWLADDAIAPLLDAAPIGNLPDGLKRDWLTRELARVETLHDRLRALTDQRGDELLAAHRRVRQAARQQGIGYRLTAHPPDVLGVYVFLPAPANASRAAQGGA
ncbi:MAG: helicase-related protein [Anaerolineae bacterium]|jgi:superfamily II DNA or RNA helicase